MLAARHCLPYNVPAQHPVRSLLKILLIVQHCLRFFDCGPRRRLSPRSPARSHTRRGFALPPPLPPRVLSPTPVEKLCFPLQLKFTSLCVVPDGLRQTERSAANSGRPPGQLVMMAASQKQHVLVTLLAAMLSYNLGYHRGYSLAGSHDSHTGADDPGRARDDSYDGHGPGGRARSIAAQLEQLVADGSAPPPPPPPPFPARADPTVPPFFSFWSLPLFGDVFCGGNLRWWC